MEKSKQLQELPDTGKPSRKRLKLPIAKMLYIAFIAVMGSKSVLSTRTSGSTLTLSWVSAGMHYAPLFALRGMT